MLWQDGNLDSGHDDMRDFSVGMQDYLLCPDGKNRLSGRGEDSERYHLQHGQRLAERFRGGDAKRRYRLSG